MIAAGRSACLIPVHGGRQMPAHSKPTLREAT
jgi:hypothetical protein